jgi:hypothetical protein
MNGRNRAACEKCKAPLGVVNATTIYTILISLGSLQKVL